MFPFEIMSINLAVAAQALQHNVRAHTGGNEPMKKAVLKRKRHEDNGKKENKLKALSFLTGYNKTADGVPFAQRAALVDRKNNSTKALQARFRGQRVRHENNPTAIHKTNNPYLQYVREGDSVAQDNMRERFGEDEERIEGHQAPWGSVWHSRPWENSRGKRHPGNRHTTHRGGNRFSENEFAGNQYSAYAPVPKLSYKDSIPLRLRRQRRGRGRR